MPPLSMHMTLARELAGQLAHPALRAEPGAYYLGSTTPDIRVLTRWERERTHFFALDDYGEQSGVSGLFRSYPELANARCLNHTTAAFLAGFVSHLEMDEAWIVTIYRPCFGERSPLKGDVLANILDRVLQYELDRCEREERAVVEEIQRDLLTSALDVAVGFIDGETLTHWRDISVELLNHPPDWDRFGIIASRHLRLYGVASEDDLAHFLGHIPDLLDQSIRLVTPERIEAFQERSRQQALMAVREYLS